MTGWAYRISVIVCGALVLINAAAIVWALVTSPRSFVLPGYECLVFVGIARFAQLCRGRAAASMIVMLMAILAAGLFIALVRIIATPHYGTVVFFYWFLMAQAIIPFSGCYVAYAFVEHSRLQRYRGGHSLQGKALVIGLLLIAAGLVYVNWIAFR